MKHREESRRIEKQRKKKKKKALFLFNLPCCFVDYGHPISCNSQYELNKKHFPGYIDLKLRILILLQRKFCSDYEIYKVMTLVMTNSFFSQGRRRRTS
jgi:hypothetical protein